MTTPRQPQASPFSNYSNQPTSPRQPPAFAPDAGFNQTQPRTPAFPSSPDFANQPTADNFAQPNFAQPNFVQPNSTTPDLGGGQDATPFTGVDSGIGAADFGAADASPFGDDGSGVDAGNISAALALTAQTASADDSAITPNLIGDFLNGQTTGTSLTTRILLNDFEDQGTTQVFNGNASAGQIEAARAAIDAARRNRITNGFNGGTTGRVTVLDGIPGIVDAGLTETFDSNDLSGNSQGVEPRVQGNITSETTTGPTTTRFNTFDRTTTTSEITAQLNEPISEAALLDIAEEQLALEDTSINDALGDFANFVDIQFIAEESIYTNRLSVVADESGSNAVPDTTSVSESESFNYIYQIAVTLPSANPGEFIGRANFTDNNSPLPRDRIYFDFNFFHNARIGTAQIPMSRFTPGFEKTYLNGLMSVEARLPMAVTVASTLTQDSDDVLDYEIGDLAFALKGLLYDDGRRAFAIGTGVTVPTADDFNLNIANGTTALSIENRTVRIQPYLAGLFRPTDKTFLQGFISADVAASGNRVLFDSDTFNSAFDSSTTGPTVSSLQDVGILQSANIVKLDLSAGRWLRRGKRDRRITDLAAVVETHLVSFVNDSDVVDLDDIAIGEADQSSILNLTVGTHMYFGASNVLTLGYGVPVTEDRFFDGELRATWNRYF